MDVYPKLWDHGNSEDTLAESVKLEPDTVRILIERIREGDESAQSELVNQIQSYVVIMADQNLDNQIRACVGPSDIVQQTMMKMVDGIDQFKGQTTPEFFGWVNMIIKNEALKSRRDQTRQKRDVRRRQSLDVMQNDSQLGFEPEQTQLTPQSDALAKERIETFHLALSRLSDEHATIIRMRNLDNLSFTEISEQLGRTKDSVSKLWYRAILKFKKELGALDEDTRQ